MRFVSPLTRIPKLPLGEVQPQRHRSLDLLVSIALGLTALMPTTNVMAALAAPPANTGRDWTVADSVAVTYFATNQVIVSPDGTRFFFATTHGDLAQDCNVDELTVYEAYEVRRALAHPGGGEEGRAKPLRTLTRPSSSNRQVPSSDIAIGVPKWESDNRTISFRGADKRGFQQLYHWDVQSGDLIAVTDWPFGVGTRPTQMKTTIFGEVDVPGSDVESEYPMHLMGRRDLRTALFGPVLPRRATFVSVNGGTPKEVPNSISTRLLPPSISPDGHKAVQVRALIDVPASWADYDKLPPPVNMAGDTLRILRADPLRFMIIDSDTGVDRPVFDAPVGLVTHVGNERAGQLFPTALWSQDGRQVILTNTALPLTLKNPERKGMAYVVAYDVGSSQWSIIEPLEDHDATDNSQRRVTKVGWLTAGTELLVAHEISGKPAPGTVYTFNGDRWVGRMVEPTATPLPDEPARPLLLGGELAITLKQSANDPPVMVASDGHHEIALSAPDLALRGIRMVRQEPFQWKDARGRTLIGGLLLPSGNFPIPRPLVIQAYQYEPDTFNPDGPSTHAYAGQALVARGMAVLNITIPIQRSQTGVGRQEVTDFVAEADSAVDALAADGSINRAKVGLIGFSRAGFNTLYAITHPARTPWAAAVDDDGTENTFMQDVMSTAALGSSPSLYGGHFWEHKADWLEYDPVFNTDRVKTPLIYTHHGDTGLATTLDVVGAFSQTRHPFELVIFPKGNHPLTRPRERLASQLMSVDWMCFWLKGETPKDPERAARWAILRKQQDEVLKTPPPPKGRWVFQPDPDQPAWTPPDAEPEEKKAEPAAKKEEPNVEPAARP